MPKRQASISQARVLLNQQWIEEGPIELTHHGHVIADIIPRAPRRMVDVTHQDEVGRTVVADAAAPQEVRRVERGQITLPPGVTRGVSEFRPVPKSGRKG
jgi:antitoxin (DNA-binding transcriptional repressor) of toxin-antitoxin stability system